MLLDALNTTASESPSSIIDSMNWFQFTVQIAVDGLVLFFLQKHYEKRQQVRKSKQPYITALENLINDAMSAFTRALQNSDNERKLTECLHQFDEKISILYYHYSQNKHLFKSISEKMARLNALNSTSLEMEKYNDRKRHSDKYLDCYNEMNEILQEIHAKCVNLKLR